jgi:hypothetical protein
MDCFKAMWAEGTFKSIAFSSVALNGFRFRGH